MTYLVAFTIENETLYHVFLECEDMISFIHDPVFQFFVNNGYTWSSVIFSEELANKCGFDMSICNK